MNISRRTLLFYSMSAGVCQAANPIIDLKVKRQELIHRGSTQPLLNTQRNAALISEMHDFFDPEVVRAGNVNSGFLEGTKSTKFTKNYAVRLKNANTGEILTLDIVKGRTPTDLGQRNINQFCRDWRRNEIIDYDMQVLQIFLNVCSEVVDEGEELLVYVTSAYRSKQTNDYLRKKNAGVAPNSYHIQGKALDFSFPQKDKLITENALHKHASGGLGVYRNFYHIDSGPKRRWSA
jgi:uncharacterized protein YcbK (DUF882 family)